MVHRWRRGLHTSMMRTVPEQQNAWGQMGARSEYPVHGKYAPAEMRADGRMQQVGQPMAQQVYVVYDERYGRAPTEHAPREQAYAYSQTSAAASAPPQQQYMILDSDGSYRQQQGYQQPSMVQPQQSSYPVDPYTDQQRLLESVLTWIKGVRSNMTTSAKGTKTRKRKTEYQCPHQACIGIFSTKQTLNEHLRVTHVEHIPGRANPSRKSQATPETSSTKKGNAPTTGAKDKNGNSRDHDWFLCVYPSCGYQCRSRSALSRHFANKHTSVRA